MRLGAVRALRTPRNGHAAPHLLARLVLVRLAFSAWASTSSTILGSGGRTAAPGGATPRPRWMSSVATGEEMGQLSVKVSSWRSTAGKADDQLMQFLRIIEGQKISEVW